MTHQDRSLAFALASLLVAASGCDRGGSPPPAEQPTPPAAERQAEAPGQEPDPAPVRIDDPSACAACHGNIVSEWQQSMHSHAHHSADPVYAGMRSFRVEREGEALAGRCASCHGPRAIDDLDGAVARTGVSCATCHNLSAVGEGRGARALTYAEDSTLRGPHGDHADGAAHPLGEAAPWLTDGQTLCLACHGTMQNREGAATCTTEAEFRQLQPEQTCTGCHMPEQAEPSGSVGARSTHRSHAFLGPHTLFDEAAENDGFMATAVRATGWLSGRELTLELENLTGHSLPTGFPGRVMLVRVQGFDADGERVFQNFTDDPMTQDPSAVFNKVYVDGEGEPVMPPYAVRVARDTRIPPGESRTLRWTLPAGVVRAEATLLYRLLPPPAVSALRLSGRPEATTRPFSTLEISRPTGP